MSSSPTRTATKSRSGTSRRRRLIRRILQPSARASRPASLGWDSLKMYPSCAVSQPVQPTSRRDRARPERRPDRSPVNPGGSLVSLHRSSTNSDGSLPSLTGDPPTLTDYSSAFTGHPPTLTGHSSDFTGDPPTLTGHSSVFANDPPTLPGYSSGFTSDPSTLTSHRSAWSDFPRRRKSTQKRTPNSTAVTVCIGSRQPGDSRRG